MFVLIPTRLWAQALGADFNETEARAFTSSNLPIIIINTQGQDIVNEPKIMARMGIIDNGPGNRNNLTDPFNAYDGWIGIERRGSSSQFTYPKNSFAVETRDESGQDLDVSLLGFPDDSDWVLYAPYGDMSLIRDELIYWLSNRIGRYASRARYCELMINGSYEGIYVLFEKIKRGKERVDIGKPGTGENPDDDVTGGYIVKIDKYEGSGVDGWVSSYPAHANPERGIIYQYHYPKPEDITEPQKEYLRNYFRTFEDVMASSGYNDPQSGYNRFIDVESFVDFMILNELSKNVDGYRLSTFLHKDKDEKGGKLVMGPIWDFNLAFGNANYYGADNYQNFSMNFADWGGGGDDWQVPFWWFRLTKDTTFVTDLTKRWRSLRKTVFRTDSLFAQIDERVDLLSEAQVRDRERWPIYQGTWPIPVVYDTYAGEINHLKTWIEGRVAWLDAHLPGAFLSINVDGENPTSPGEWAVVEAYPNPFSSYAEIVLTTDRTGPATVTLYDLLGRRISVLFDDVMFRGERKTIQIDGAYLPAGTFYYVVESGSHRAIMPLQHVK